MKLTELSHAITGTIGACQGMKDLIAEKKDRASLPTSNEMVKALHRIETASYDNLIMVAQWLQLIIGAINEKDNKNTDSVGIGTAKSTN